MDTDKNEGVQDEDVPTDGAQEKDLFQLDVVKSGYDSLDVEQLKNCDSPIASEYYTTEVLIFLHITICLLHWQTSLEVRSYCSVHKMLLTH